MGCNGMGIITSMNQPFYISILPYVPQSRVVVCQVAPISSIKRLGNKGWSKRLKTVTYPFRALASSTTKGSMTVGKKSALGVLFTGYLQKYDPNAYIGKTKNRFVVLTHESLHWFKREAGYDLFGEERGSIALSDIDQAAAYPSREGNPPEACFMVSTTDFLKRVFIAKDKEEATKWINAINTAIKSRFMYRRETLSGLSFLAAADDSETSRPRVLLLSLDQPDGKGEVIISRRVEYHKPLELAPIAEGDKLIFTFSNGLAATVPGNEIIDQMGKEEPFNVKINGGVLGGVLVCSSRMIRKTPKKAEVSSHGGLAHDLLMEFVRTEVTVPLIMSVFLVLVVMSLIRERGEYLQVCTETREGSMLFVALALLLHVISILARDLSKPKETTKAVVKTSGILLEIEDYTIEAPQSDEQLDASQQIPKRFVDGCLGDMKEAMRRWRLTLEWRRDFGSDTILDQPHQYFDLIKQCYPHYYCLQGREGDPVYIERSGQVDQPRMRAAGCNVDNLIWHYIYMTEFLYCKLYQSETAKTITLFDVEGVGIRDLAGDAFEFLRRSASLIQEHYPERSKVIMIINAPSWFSFLWKMIRPMVNERTQKKVKIVKGGKETLECIKEFVEPKNIPDCYGGELRYGDGPDSCRWNSPEEKALREHVHEVNKRHDVEMRMS